MSKLKRFINFILISLVVLLCVSVGFIATRTDSRHVSQHTTTSQTTDVPENPPDEPELVIDPVLENNSWETIKAAFRAGVAADYWQVGDTKTINVYDGYTYTVRIADMAEGRYAYSDGSGYSNNVFEFVECMATVRQINSTSTNVGGFAACAMRTALNTTVYNQLPVDLRAVIAEVSISSTIGGGSSEVSFSDNKLFLASEQEIFGTTIYSKSVPVQFGYWALHNSNADRIKTAINSTSVLDWWLRNPIFGFDSLFCHVSMVGDSDNFYSDSFKGVCPFFCL